ncbi:MAG: hypothetical protein J6S85_19070 [Methanobrevibacter sp.]|nr:hypothetical protein [Methanobrevibacter sp.]
MADGDLHLSESPNVDTGLVEMDGSLHRTVLTAVPEGTLQLSDSANVSTGYVTDSDGKKHKVNLVAEVTGSLELSDNPSVDTGYVTDGDGKKHKVKLTASLHGGGGSAPVIDELNVTPSTSAQTITAPGGTDGYSPVNVAAVTSAIDANIVAGNIKKDVSILGVTGNYEGVAPSGTKSITTNGIHDVAGYANADVQVPTTAPTYYVTKTTDANGKLKNYGTPMLNFSGVKDIYNYVLYGAFLEVTFPQNTSLDMSDLIDISGINACTYAFAGHMSQARDTNLTSVDLSSLTTISGISACQNMFTGCKNLTSVDLSSLTTISGSSACSGMFSACSNLTNIELNSLTTVTGTNCFSSFCGNAAVTSIKMNALNTITVQLSNVVGAFSNARYLSSVELGGLTSSTFSSATNQLQYLFGSTTGNLAANGCTLHFPSNFDPSDPNHTFDASTLTGYPTFGGSASYIHVAFDLPATE